ncbi:MAG: hypothetical protein EPN79_16085 [Burkholderiaceae bacterium]|nr:MAG: hypothetical protein EPN79_16085 [Burkholderiaceae bacterium]
MTNTPKHHVLLAARGNPDHGQLPEQPPFGTPGDTLREVPSIAAAQQAVKDFIEANDLGGGNWVGGDLWSDGKHAGRISYNGRLWPNEQGPLVRYGEFVFDAERRLQPRVADVSTVPADQERQQLVDNVRKALARYVELGLYTDPAVLLSVKDALVSPDGERAVAAMRRDVVAFGTAPTPTTPTRQKVAYEAYTQAQYALRRLDHHDCAMVPSVWKESQNLADDTLASLVRDGGYAAIKASPALQLAYQDVLDHVLQERLFNVRQWMRSQAWGGEPYAQRLVTHFDGEPWVFQALCKHVGAGKNVVGLSYCLWQGDGSGQRPEDPRKTVVLDDNMVMAASDMPEFLNRYRMEVMNQRAAQEAQAELGRVLEDVAASLGADGDFGSGYVAALRSIGGALKARGVAQELVDSAVAEAGEAYTELSAARGLAGPQSH